jgi:8-oxo-dGTP pyrophosphatase MutT (NUDIX family)
MAEFSIATLRELGTRLTTEHTLEDYREDHRLAAVLILAYPDDRESHIVLTRRTHHLPNHAGQISFPGGSIEAGDRDPVHTALREAREEINLDDNDVDVLGILDVTVLPSGFAVAPVLAVSDRQPSLIPNPDEVAEIFSIPLSMISNLTLYRQDSVERDGVRRQFYYLNYGEYYIWGATARMLRDLAGLLQEGSGR